MAPSLTVTPRASGIADRADRETAIATMVAVAGFHVEETIVAETEYGLEVTMCGGGKMIFEVLAV